MMPTIPAWNRPAIVVIGNVVKLRDGLDWLGFATSGKVLISDPLGLQNGSYWK